jgi:hypothetical protein
MSGSGLWWAYFDQNFQRTYKVLSKSGSQVYSWVLLQKTHNIPTDQCDQSGEYLLKKLSVYLLGKVWVNCLKTLKKLSICLPGKTPLTPSVLV